MDTDLRNKIDTLEQNQYLLTYSNNYLYKSEEKISKKYIQHQIRKWQKLNMRSLKKNTKKIKD